LKIRTAWLLERSHDYILPTLLPPPPFVEHAQRFAHPRRIAQEYFQPPARLAPFAGFHAAQQLARIGTAVFSLRHAG
jgi:hypothetical protein